MTQDSAAETVRLIKKYPNRRLYDTCTSSYITLADVKQLVMASESFAVVDAKSNDDITRSILLQIILEEESANVPMFSTEVLSHIIRFYGSAMQGVMGSYLEQNIQAFIEIQERLLAQSKHVYGKPVGPEAWAQFMTVQTPMIQKMMNSYAEQSQKIFTQVQDQMQDQMYGLFTAFPFASPAPTKEKTRKPKE